MRIGLRDIPLFDAAFYFLRHGETESNVRGIVAGSTDVALTELGHTQARTAATALEPCGITAIYTSNLRRARDTADHVARVLRLPVHVIPELAERNWGAIEGKPRSMRIPGVTPPGAEGPDQYAERILKGLARIDSAGVPLIVAHSGVFRVLCRTLGVPEADDPIHNARPIHCLPPETLHAAWRFEFIWEPELPAGLATIAGESYRPSSTDSAPVADAEDS